MQKIMLSTEVGNVEKPGWKGFWESPNREKLDRVDNVMEAHEEFLRNFSKRNRDAIRKFGEGELEKLMSQNLELAARRMTHHHGYEGFWRKVGHNAVRFTKTVSDYFEAYSGIIEIMKDADQHYGGVAYATISLLLIVAVNKNRIETCIDETLRTLQREFIRVQTVRRIHGTQTMQGLVCDAFVESILFLRWATQYYGQSTWRRIVEAVFRPPNIELDQSVTRIARAVAEIEKERDTLDSQRLFEVQSELGEVRSTVNGVQLRIEDVEARDEGTLVNQLKEMIAPPIQDRVERLAEYEHALDSAFRNLRRFTPFEMPILEHQEAYRTWSANSFSSLLLLYGETRPHAGHCCWLSPTLSFIVRQAQSQGKTLAWFCCQKDAVLSDQVPITTIIRDLTDQLLHQSRSQLRKQAWYEEVSRYAKAVSNGTQNVNAHFELLQKVLQSFSEVYLAIDRVDLVKGETWQWMRHFVKLIKNSSQTLRVLFIASSDGNMGLNGKLEPQLFKFLEQKLHHQFLRIELNDS